MVASSLALRQVNRNRHQTPPQHFICTQAMAVDDESR